MVRILLSSISAPLSLRPPRIHSRDKCSQAFPVFPWSSAPVYYCEHKWKVKSRTVARYMCTCVLDKYRLEVWQAHYKGDRISYTIATWQLPLLHVYRRHKISTWGTLKDQTKEKWHHNNYIIPTSCTILQTIHVCILQNSYGFFSITKWMHKH